MREPERDPETRLRGNLREKDESRITNVKVQ